MWPRLRRARIKASVTLPGLPRPEAGCSQQYASRKGVRQVGIDVLWWSGVLLTLFVVGAFVWIFNK